MSAISPEMVKQWVRDELRRILDVGLMYTDGCNPNGTATTVTAKPTAPTPPPATTQTALDKTEAAITTAQQIGASQDAFGNTKTAAQLANEKQQQKEQEHLTISDLKDGMKKVNIKAFVAEISDTRQVNGPEGPTTLANATITDEKGAIKLPLWGDQIDRVKVGSQIHLVNGYVSSYKGEIQLNVGKWGKLEVT